MKLKKITFLKGTKERRIKKRYKIIEEKNLEKIFSYVFKI